MPDRNRDRSARRGPQDDHSSDPKKGLLSRANALLTSLLEESPTDSFGERLADVAARNQAEKVGVAFADHLAKVPGVRKLIRDIPAGLLEYLGQVAAGYAADKWLPEAERTKDWIKEFAQGFARRVTELQEGKASTASAAAAGPAAPPAPREMSASEVLSKHPEITALLDRGLNSTSPTERQLATEVQVDLHRHLNYAHEGITLAAPAPLLPPPFDTTLNGFLVRQSVVDFIVANCPAAERPALYEELRKRITSQIQLAELLAPFPAAAPAAIPPIDFTKIGDKLDWLRGEYPAPADFSTMLGRLAPHVVHAGRKDYLFSAPADAGLPAAVAQSAAWSAFTATAVGVAPDEAAALIADAETRVATVLQAQDLRVPPAGAVQLTVAQLKQRILALPKRVAALTKTIFEQRLSSLEIVHPAPTTAARPLSLADVRARLLAIPERKGELTLDLLKSRMELIKDGSASRSVSAFAGRTGKLLSQLGADVAGTVVGDIANGLRNLKI